MDEPHGIDAHLDTIVRVGRCLADSGHVEAALWVGLCKTTFTDDELLCATTYLRIGDPFVGDKTRLIVACETGCGWRIRQLLRDEKGRLRLKLQLNESDLEHVDYPDDDDYQPGTPLQAAVEHNHVDIVRLLLEAGADPSISEWVQKLPMITAARHKHEEVVALLREAGAELSGDDGYRYVSALAAACRQPLNFASMGAAQQAEAEAKALRLADSLLAAGQPANGTHPLANGNYWQEDPDLSDLPLWMAAQWSAVLVRRLVAAGANVRLRMEDMSEILHHVRSGEVARALREVGADVYAMNDKLHTPLFNATLDVTAALLDAGHDPNFTNEGGTTPLYYPSCPEVVELLCSRGADVNAAHGEERHTVLHVAMHDAAAFPVDICRALLQSGASPRSRHFSGCTAFHFLAMGHRHAAADSAEVADMLLCAGADINATCSMGKSPLMYAGSVEMVDVLLQRGARMGTACIGTVLMRIAAKEVKPHLPSAAAVIRRLRLAGAPGGNLITAVQTGSVEVVEAMLEDLPGAAPTFRNVWFYKTLFTAAHIAAKKLNPALLRVVLSAVSRPYAQRVDAKGFTALHSFAWAYIQRSDSASPDDFMATATEIVGMLRDAGISLGAQDNLGRTACDIIELSNGHNDPVARLLDGREP